MIHVSYLSLTDRAPEEASRIANSLREVAAQKIISVTRVSDVTTLEEARPATSPSSPNIRRNTMIGFLAGVVVMIATVILIELLDTGLNDQKTLRMLCKLHY